MPRRQPSTLLCLPLPSACISCWLVAAYKCQDIRKRERGEMAEENSGSPEEQAYDSRRTMTTEIVEIGDNRESETSSRDGGESKDIYVAVGKNDLEVLTWALDHAVEPGSRVYLVHVFSPIHSIPTPVGRLSRSQLNQEQLRPYIQEENVRRRNLLQKYINLCNQAKVAVDTILIESDFTAKAILELIPVLNISSLIMGTKRLPSRRLRKGLGKGEFVKKKAPDLCEVVIVWDGKRVVDGQQRIGLELSSPESSSRRPKMERHGERNFFECACFSGKFI